MTAPTGPGRATPAVWTVRSLLEARLGMSIDEAAAARVEEQLHQELGPDERLAVRLAALAKADLGRPQWRSLLRLVLVNKTSFFRHREQLLAAAAFFERQGRPPATIWSAACSTGEEPYSLAALFPAAVVLGTDVDERALAVARVGDYPRAELDTVPPECLGRLGTTRGERGLCVAAAARQAVSFEHLNLAGDAPLPRAPFGPGWSLILCRNVLIYFTAHEARRVLTRMAERLAPNGLLLLSPAERPPARVPLDTIQVSERVFGYARRDRSLATFPARATPPPPPPPPVPLARPALGLPLVGTLPPSPAPATPPPPAAAPDEAVGAAPRSRVARLLEQAEAAELNDEARARRLLDQAAELADLDPQLHWKIGRALRRIEAPDAAAKALRRALLLDPDLWAASYQLAGIEFEAERYREARREYHRTVRLLEAGGGEDERYRDEVLASCQRRIRECRVSEAS